MFVRFFIDRPIFASVLSIVITLAGALAVGTLPLSQYPPVTPPTIQIDCNYPGASAQVVSETIAAPIEQQVNGVERMLYMTSQSTSDGSYTCTVTFDIGTNLNLAQVLVQNRVNLALPNLPDVVQATGVTTRKRSAEILLTVSLDSPDGSYNQLYLSNYAFTRVRDELSRLPGISDITLFGQRDYAMRVWIDPEKLSSRNMTAIDVINALAEQNIQVAAGMTGQAPTAGGSDVQLTLDTLGRLTTPEEFGQVVVKATRDGKVVKLRDVARIALGAKNEDVSNAFDHKSTVGIAVFLLTGANALDTGDLIVSTMNRLKKDFPPGIEYEIGYDTTPFIRESIREVFKSLRDAVILVAIVVLVFLQSWRAAIIPLAAVPVAIIGTFGAMWVLGYSLNNLTLFGLVLAVGIVVDDAIVVVEAVQHHIERGLAPRAATIRAMEEVTGPIVAVGVVLAAVFVPCMFLDGVVGQFFRQFAITIAVSTLISTINSLTLSPALAALLLRSPHAAGSKRQDALPWLGVALIAGTAALFLAGDFPAKYLPEALSRMGKNAATFAAGAAVGFALGWPVNWILALFFRGFNYAFDHLGGGYVRSVGIALRAPLIALVVYGGLIYLGWSELQKLPAGFIPQQDKGYLIASVQLPDSAAAVRSRDIIDRIATIALETPGVHHVNAVAGNSFVLSAYGSNFGSMFIILDQFADRRGRPELYSEVVMAKLRQRVEQEVPEAKVAIFGAPPVSGLGRAGGFRVMVEDRGSNGPLVLEREALNLIQKGNPKPKVEGVPPEPATGLVGMFTVYATNSPQLFVRVDRTACISRGVDLAEVFGTLQATMGARYVNDFNLFGRTWQVNVQAEPGQRSDVRDVGKLKVRNRNGDMIPLAALLTVEPSSGPLVVTRHNTYPAAPINGNVAPGFSTGQAYANFKELADRELPADSMAFEWSELAFIEQKSKSSALKVFGLSVIFVFLALSALYESWLLPLAVILVVPVCVVGSLVAVDVANQDVNIFTQVGFVVLVGLACKNAILIVEFAKLAREKGEDRRTAVLEACRLRFRPILMTSVAFILGVLPLLTSAGAGAEMRKALGTAVFGGMIGVTAFGIVLTPVFFVLVDWAGSMNLRSTRLKRLGRVVGGVITFTYVRRVGRYVAGQVGRRIGRLKLPQPKA